MADDFGDWLLSNKDKFKKIDFLAKYDKKERPVELVVLFYQKHFLRKSSSPIKKRRSRKTSFFYYTNLNYLSKKIYPIFLFYQNF